MKNHEIYSISLLYILYFGHTYHFFLQTKNDEDKLGGALTRLSDENPTIKVKKNVETGQLLLSGMGELHTDIMAERMKRKFGVDVLLKILKCLIGKPFGPQLR